MYGDGFIFMLKFYKAMGLDIWSMFPEGSVERDVVNIVFPRGGVVLNEL